MKTFRERENALFERWLQACIECDGISADEFAYDGLLYRGECRNIAGCWEMQPGNETELWMKAPCRLVILTKDTTKDGGLDDMRIETARKNHCGLQVLTYGRNFYRNLMLWSYALLNGVQGGEILSYDDTPDWDTLRGIYTSAAIARVNCKKQIGESIISNANLKAHIKRYSEFLKEQVDMYDADIILCCGGGGVIKDFVKECCVPDMVKYSDAGWVYYSLSTHKIVIDSYHPSVLKNMRNMYEGMMEDLKNFLSEFPEFARPRR